MKKDDRPIICQIGRVRIRGGKMTVGETLFTLFMFINFLTLIVFLTGR